MKVNFSVEFSINDETHPKLVKLFSTKPFDLKKITIGELLIAKVEQYSSNKIKEIDVFLRPSGELKVE